MQCKVSSIGIKVIYKMSCSFRFSVLSNLFMKSLLTGMKLFCLAKKKEKKKNFKADARSEQNTLIYSLSLSYQRSVRISFFPFV